MKKKIIFLAVFSILFLIFALNSYGWGPRSKWFQEDPDQETARYNRERSQLHPGIQQTHRELINNVGKGKFDVGGRPDQDCYKVLNTGFSEENPDIQTPTANVVKHKAKSLEKGK